MRLQLPRRLPLLPLRRTSKLAHPSPPKLPKAQQAEFDRLKSEAAAAAETKTTPEPLRKGAPPEFEGDANPATGEVGGPKNEPLRWGSAGDWSYNGRVTDF
ncbi:hypothetical protein CP533_2517 [Ophiocordyceps camponoti-saundersi (nom. inval.)]|nr:hypothetical protein CP533_2517 [Ophiocordyceps camponoti-saundersi (nom. inval.)]